ncbi:MAG: flagellar hook protein FlgE, partial [Lentisphaeria bacterium]
NAQIFAPTAPQTSIDLAADAVDLGGGNFAIEVSAVEEGLNSSIVISNESANAGDIGLGAALLSTAGIPQVTNGYPAQAIDITIPSGAVITYNASAGATASATASELNALQGLTATAVTNLTLSNYNNSAGNLLMSVNGITLTGDSLAAIEVGVNALTNTTLPGITAELDLVTGVFRMNSAGGDDIEIAITSTDDGDSLTVLGDPDAAAVTLEVDSLNDGLSAATNEDAGLNSVVVGGSIEVVLDEGYDILPQTSGGLFQPLNPDQFTDIIVNDFTVGDQSTYNSATSMTVYDSLGISHVMTQYFVRQEYDPTDPTSIPNHWQVHIQIDGQDVSDPDTTLPPPQNTEATRATYDVFFNDDGTFNDVATDVILVSNWLPVNEDGQSNSAAGPQNVLAGGSVPIPEPPTSSNFVIEFDGTTQFGSAFSVNNVDQDGYATGRLSGLSIDDSGIIFARFTNGESQVLGQVALADFQNQEGLQPTGNSTWVENFESGEPRVAGANTGSLGVIQSGALEESNVDLSAALVNLIIAQRNFQANAKTIETADTVTQTIINLR